MSIYYMIVIIGAGFAGIQCLYEIVKSGESKIMLLEKSNNVGGLWFLHDTINLKCQTSSNFYRIPEYPPIFKNTPNKIQICNYLKKFIIKNKLEKYIYFNSLVTNINKEKHLVYYCFDHIHKIIKCDYVIDCTGKIPKYIDKDVKRKYKKIHSVHFSKDIIEEIKNNTNTKEEVLLIGGGKSSMEHAYELKKKNISFLWTCRSSRKPYIIFFPFTTVDPYLLIKNWKFFFKKNRGDGVKNISLGEQVFHDKWPSGHRPPSTTVHRNHAILEKKTYNVIKNINFTIYKSIIFDDQYITIDSNKYTNVKYCIFATGFKRNIIKPHDNFFINFYDFEYYDFYKDIFTLTNYSIRSKIIQKKISVKSHNFDKKKISKYYSKRYYSLKNLLRMVLNKNPRI